MANLAYAKGRWMNLEKPGGAVFFVGGGTVAYNGIGASDENKGLTPEAPLATIDGTAGAHAKCVAGRGDTIVVLPGTVTITAAIALDLADVTLTGYCVTGPKSRNPSVITCATNSVEMIAVDAANVVVENLTLTNTAATADVFLIDVGDTTSSSGAILRNLFIDCEGGTTTVNAIRIGDGTVVSDYCLIEGCVIYDLDDIGITVSAASEGCLIRNCDIFDAVSANVMLTGIYLGGPNTSIEDCYIMNSYANANGACIQLAAAAVTTKVRNCHLSALGTACHGILIATGGTGLFTGLHIAANALTDTVDCATPLVGNTGFTGWASAPADGTVCELLDPQVA